MRKEKFRAFLLLLIIILNITPLISYGASESANISTQGTLGEFLAITNIVVNGTNYAPDAFLTGMTKESVVPIDPVTNLLNITPVSVIISTNMYRTLRVTADFTQLKHIATGTFIPNADLSIIPTFYDKDPPFGGGFQTSDFSLSTKVRPDTLTGVYEGTLVFTVAAKEL